MIFMAAKIINKEPSPRVAKQLECRNCGATLEYVPADTRKETRRDYTGDSSEYTLLDCPNCQHVITLHCT